MKWSFAIALVFSGFAARAVPPDARLTVAPGAEKFLKTHFRIDSVLVQPEGFVFAEGEPANEVYLSVPQTAHGAGLVLAFGVDRLFAWDLCVSGDNKDCPAPTDLSSAKGACPDLAQKTEDGHPVWSASIKDGACLTALTTALAHAEVPSKNLAFTLEEQGAKAFYERVTTAIQQDSACNGLTAGYYGATLKLGGKASRKGIDRALLHAYELTAGHVSYDASEVQLSDAPKPAPAGPPPVKEIPLKDSLAFPHGAPDGGTTQEKP